MVPLQNASPVQLCWFTSSDYRADDLHIKTDDVIIRARVLWLVGHQLVRESERHRKCVRVWGRLLGH